MVLYDWGQAFATYWTDLAARWQGWDGPIETYTDTDLKFIAEHDGLGRVTVTVIIGPRHLSEGTWATSAVLVVDPGGLERIADDFRRLRSVDQVAEIRDAEWISLGLFREEARRLRRLTGYAYIRKVSVTVTQDESGSDSVLVDGMPEEALIAYVATIRKFVSRPNPLFLRRVLESLKHDAAGDVLRDVDRRLGRFDHLADVPPGWSVTIPGDHAPLSRWQAFDVWTNSHLVHDEVDKLGRWQRMTKHDQGVGRWLAYSYMADLTALVDATNAMVEVRLVGAREAPSTGDPTH